MKTQFKNPANNLVLFFLALMAMFICGCGCNTSKPTPDPLAGWKKDFAPQLDPVIAKDCQDYIQTLTPDERQSYQINGYYNDGAGQHAVQIEVALNGTWWRHILVYDKDNKRIKTIKYSHGGYRS
jgi:hypothetical protein